MRPILRFFLTCFTFLVLGFNLAAQQVILESFGLQEGLPSLNVYALHIDVLGYLWVGTPEGLVRYDGQDFELVPGNPRPGKPIMEIWSDAKNRIWYQIAGGEVFFLDQGLTFPYDYNEDILSYLNEAQNRSINSTYMDEEETLHLGFNGMGYLKIDVKGESTFLNSSNHPPGHHVQSLDGKLFDFGITDPNATNQHQLKELRIELDGFSFVYNYTYKPKHQMPFLRSCYALKDGRILVVSGNHLLEVFPDLHFKEHYFPNAIYHILEDEEGRLIISYLIGGSQAFTPDLSPLPIQFSPLDGSRIGLFMADSLGGYWIKSSNQGLYYLRSLDILRVGPERSGKASQITSICHDGKGTLYYATSDGALLQIPPNMAPQKMGQLSPDGSMGRIVQFMLWDSSSNSLLMATNSANLLWQDGQLKKLPSKGRRLAFLLIVEMEESQFMGLHGHVIAPFPFGKAADQTFPTVDPQGFVAGAIHDGEGGLWITAKDKIMRYRQGALEKQELGLPEDQPWVFGDLIEDSRGRIWIGGGTPGLILLESKGTAEWIGSEQGLPGGFVLGAVPMPNGDVWVVQREGLVRMRPTKEGVFEFKVLNRVHGLLTPGIETDLFDGEFIWASDPYGLIRIDPQRVRLDFPPAPIHLSAVETKDSTYTQLPAELARDQNSLTFHYRSLDFRQSGNHLYQYRMPGHEDDWVTTSTNQVRFPQLPPGQYTFEVRAANPQGTWGPSIQQLFRILPAFYETWWFLLLVVLLSCFLLFGVFAATLFRIRRANKAREQNLLYEQEALNAQMNPHFVFNSLNSIQAFIVKNDSRNSIRYLSKFARLMRNSLDASQSRTISLQAEINLLQHYCELEKLRFGGGFDFEIVCSSDLDLEKIGLPTYLLQPHVENAIWHGLQHLPKEARGQLRIVFSKQGPSLCCKISDNGVGRKAAVVLEKKPKEHQSYALQIVKKRLTLLQKIHKKAHFTIEIEDLKDTNGNAKGTLVEVRMSILKLESVLQP